MRYSEGFLLVQQERNCRREAGDPFALWEASIDRIIAKFKSVGTGGLTQDLVSSLCDQVRLTVTNLCLDVTG